MNIRNTIPVVNTLTNKKKLLFYIIAIFSFAFFLRFFHLGNIPLNSFESQRALEALNSNQRYEVVEGGYVILTRILFFFFNATNFAARFWPALIGSAAVLIPFIFKGQIGELRTIFLSLFLAIDPLFVAASRQVNSRIFALIAISFIYFGIIKKNRLVTIISCTMGLLCGQNFWLGGFIQIIYFFINYLKEKNGTANIKSIVSIKRIFQKKYCVFFLPMLFLMLVLVPGLLDYITKGFILFLKGWLIEIYNPSTYINKLLIFFSYFPIIFIVIPLITHKLLISKNTRISNLKKYCIVGFLVILIYPNANVVDFLWISAPFWYLLLVGLEDISFGDFIKDSDQQWIAAIGFTLCCFLWLNFLSFSRVTKVQTNLIPYILETLGSFLLILIFIMFAIAFWSKKKAISGLIISVLFFVGILQIGQSFRVANIMNNGEMELLRDSGYFKDADLLKKTMNQITIANEERKESILIKIDSSIDQTPIIWLLREYNLAEIYLLDQFNSSANTIFYILNSEKRIENENDFYSQSYVTSSEPVWNINNNLKEFLYWFLFREGSVTGKMVKLWIPTDIFAE